jgi:hypothetical protein
MSEPTQAVQLNLYLDRDRYSVGEPVVPRLQILNTGATLVEFLLLVFDWDRLAFSDPSAAHLVAPSGQDLLLPYRRAASDIANEPPIRITPDGEEWLYLPISSYLHLRQPGWYTFWLELLDEMGRVHRSNDVIFNLEDVEPSRSPESIGLTIAPQQTYYTAGEPVDIEVSFTNRASEAVTLLTPQQDSLDGWVNPMYQFTVMDSAGRGLPLARRSGTMATPVYDDASRFTLEPGGSRALQVRLPVFPDMRNPGEYHVWLTYIVRERAIGKAGVVLDQRMNWPKGTFTGRLESNEVVVVIE